MGYNPLGFYYMFRHYLQKPAELINVWINISLSMGYLLKLYIITNYNI